MSIHSRLTIDEFAAELPRWYLEYTKSPYFEQYKNLEAGLSQKARDVGYLEKGDLMWIAIWGGDEERHQLGTKISSMNTDENVKRHTQEAIRHLDSPASALRSLLSINNVGLAYATKTLRCICPQNYPALDRHTRRACEDLSLDIDDNDEQSVVAGYLWFIEICRRIQEKVSASGPRPGNLWFIADIEMALFQFARPPQLGKLMVNAENCWS